MARMQISDRKNSLLTVQLYWAPGPVQGYWLPDYPGKVRSSLDASQNPYDLVQSGPKSEYSDAICYTLDSTGARVLVMRFNGATLWGGGALFMKQGSGFLYESGNLTMTAGVFTW